MYNIMYCAFSWYLHFFFQVRWSFVFVLILWVFCALLLLVISSQCQLQWHYFSSFASYLYFYIFRSRFRHPLPLSLSPLLFAPLWPSLSLYISYWQHSTFLSHPYHCIPSNHLEYFGIYFVFINFHQRFGMFFSALRCCLSSKSNFFFFHGNKDELSAIIDSWSSWRSSNRK